MIVRLREIEKRAMKKGYSLKAETEEETIYYNLYDRNGDLEICSTRLDTIFIYLVRHAA